MENGQIPKAEFRLYLATMFGGHLNSALPVQLTDLRQAAPSWRNILISVIDARKEAIVLLLLQRELIIHFVQRLIGIALTCALFAASANAVRQLVIIEEPQPAQRIEGVVLDPNGDPIEGMTVTDRTDDGTAVLRSTITNAKGHFHFSTQTGKTVYCLRFEHPLWNPLQVRLKLDKHAPQRGITARPQIGG